MPQPLEGYRVIDMTEVWAGPMGTTFLADLGAEVVRVESFPRASMTRPVSLAMANLQQRSSIPADATRPWDFSTTYHLPNRNKLGIALNVVHPSGRPVFERLVAASDVLVIGYSAGTIVRMGLDYASVSKLRPDIILVSMPGWGERGPYKGYTTLGSGLDAFAGHFYLRGYPDSDPTSTPVGVFHSDATGALALAFAVMTALHYRERTGRGQYIDLSQAEVLMTHLARPMLDWSLNRRVMGPVGNGDLAVAPHGCYACAGENAWVTIVARTEEQWRALVAAMGSPDWALDAGLASNEGRLTARERVDAGIGEWTRTLSQAEVFERLSAAGVPVGPVYDAPSLLADAQFRERGFFVESKHPPAPDYLRAAAPWRLAATPSEFRLPTNNLGEHNREVLCGLLGLADSDYERLLAEGVIGDAYGPGSEVDAD